MIERALLSKPRFSSNSLKLPLFFTFLTGLVFFFISKTGLPPLTSPLALIACWFVEKTSFFTSLIAITLLSAPLDSLYGTESKMWMVSHTIASLLSYWVPTRILNLPARTRWAFRVLIWSFIVINIQLLAYPENFCAHSPFDPSRTRLFFNHFFESLALSIYDGCILGAAAYVSILWLREE